MQGIKTFIVPKTAFEDLMARADRCTRCAPK
jgi:hypothetical protein